MTKLLFLAGSARKDSLNKKLARLASEKAKALGAEITFIDLKDFDMPIYDGDIEAQSSLPDNARKLKKLFVEHDGFFIASPEYNSSFAPLLKNALDWISRPHEQGEASLVAYKGKVASLSAVSPGALGGLRGLVPLRMMLGNLGAFLTPTQVAISTGFDAFTESGALKHENQNQMLDAAIVEFVKTASALKA